MLFSQSAHPAHLHRLLRAWMAHSVRVHGTRLYEPAARAVAAFREHGWAAKALTRNATLRVEVHAPPVVHDVPLNVAIGEKVVVRAERVSMSMPMMEILAVLTCALFAGASIYINLVEHPARLSCGTEIAARQWAPSYKRATVMQVSLAVVSAIAGSVRGAQGGGWLWFLAAALIFSVIPFTAVVVMPTNNRLLEPATGRAGTMKSCG